MMANVLEGLVAPKSPGAKGRVPDGSKPGAGSKGPGIDAIRSSCTFTSERVMPRLGTAPRGGQPEPHPRQHRGFLAHLGARLRRAGQSSRAPRTPFRSAATVLALLTTLTLSLGFTPSAGAQTFTCGALDLAGRTEIWRATLTVGHVEAELTGITRPLWDGYDEDDGGELSDTSFEIGATTWTIHRLYYDFNGDLDFHVSGGTEFNDLHPLRLHVCHHEYEIAEATRKDPIEFIFEWDGDEHEFVDLTLVNTIEVALSKEINSQATGEPLITGMTRFRGVLSVGPGNIDDANGLEETLYSYQWIRIDGRNETEILGATSETYALTGRRYRQSDQSGCNVHRRCRLSRREIQ